MSSIPSVAAASEMVAGLITFGVPATSALTTFLPSDGRVDARRVEQHDHLGGRGDLAGRDEREVVEQVLRVGHDPDDAARLSACAPGVTDAQVQVGGQPAGQGDLVGSAGGSSRLPGRASAGRTRRSGSARAG